jgi:glycine/D-amino acid oxidase-like deaminating enzyme
MRVPPPISSRDPAASAMPHDVGAEWGDKVDMDFSLRYVEPVPSPWWGILPVSSPDGQPYFGRQGK